jgi:hypothetical protein
MRHWQRRAASLQRQVEFERERRGRRVAASKGPRTRNQTLTAKNRMAWQAAKENPGYITKADRNKLPKALHPDAEAGVSAERQKILTEASQIFSPLNEYWNKKDRERSRAAKG